MKNQLLTKTLFLFLGFMVVVSSCDNDDDGFIEPPINDTTSVDTTIIDTRGNLISVELMYEYTADEVGDVANSLQDNITLFYPPLSSIGVYKIIYETIDSKNNITTASGLLTFPTDHFEQPYDVCSYAHGTIVERNRVPSKEGGEYVIGLLLASAKGYVGILPDYVGLGDGPGFHPYVHARSEAASVVDMIRASETFCDSLNIEWSDKMFLYGYSQGGHAALAAHKMIQEDFSDQYTVTASAPMSGPYDISGAQTELLLAEQSYPAPYYLPYVLLSYNQAYDMYDSVSEFFLPPYDSLVVALYNGENSAGTIDNYLLDTVVHMIRPEVVEDFKNDMNHPFRVALRDNDLYDWTPQTPVRLYYCSGDRYVAPDNSVNCYNEFIANGVNVELFDFGADNDHNDCVLPSFADGLLWFDSFRN